MQNIHDTDFFSLFYIPNGSLFEAVWKKPKEKAINNDVFKQHLLVFVDLINKHGIKNFLVDSRQHHIVMDIALQEWHDAQIVPQYIKAGIKKIAFVMPPDIFSAVSLQQAFDETNAKVLDTRYFDNYDEAKKWIQ